MGVKIGPQDIDASERLGAGKQDTSTQVRQLIRHHRRMYPAALQAALSHVRNEPRSKALVLREVAEVVGEDLPEGATLTGATVRGEEDNPTKFLTYTFRTAENETAARTGKGACEWDPDRFPLSAERGDAAAEVAAAKEAGLPVINGEMLAAVAQMAGASSGGKPERVEVEVPVADPEQAAEIERLKGELEAATSRAESAEAANAAPPEGDAANDETPAQAEPPFAEYEELTAAQIADKVKESDDVELAGKVIAYETRPGGTNRQTITQACNRLLDRPPSGE